jgi:hypothetical protein
MKQIISYYQHSLETSPATIVKTRLAPYIPLAARICGVYVCIGRHLKSPASSAAVHGAHPIAGKACCHLHTDIAASDNYRLRTTCT